MLTKLGKAVLQWYSQSHEKVLSPTCHTHLPQRLLHPSKPERGGSGGDTHSPARSGAECKRTGRGNHILPNDAPDDASSLFLPLLEQKQIPRLDEHLQLWTRQVVAAFRQGTIAMPLVLKPYIEKLVIADPQAVMLRSDSSATGLLADTYHKEIEAEVRSMLAGYLKGSTLTWQMLTDRYGIWSRSKVLLGEEPLPILGPDPQEHLVRIFFTTYLETLAREELNLRTTPVFQGTGSFYEILNKKAQL